MRKLLGFIFIAGFLLGCSASPTAAQQNHAAAVTDYAVAKVRPWLTDPVVIEAVKAQNL